MVTNEGRNDKILSERVGTNSKPEGVHYSLTTSSKSEVGTNSNPEGAHLKLDKSGESELGTNSNPEGAHLKLDKSANSEVGTNSNPEGVPLWRFNLTKQGWAPSPVRREHSQQPAGVCKRDGS